MAKKTTPGEGDVMNLLQFPVVEFLAHAPATGRRYARVVMVVEGKPIAHTLEMTDELHVRLANLLVMHAAQDLGL